MIPLLVLALLVGAVFSVALGFAAVALDLRLRNARRAHRRGALEERWKPLLLLTMAGDDPTHLASAVAPSERLFFIEYVFRYATRVQGAERDALRDAVAPFLPALLPRLGHEAEVEQRARALRTVGVLGGSDYLPHLVDALNDPSPLVAMTAARTLARRGHPEFVELLLDRTERFRDWSPRYLASLLASAGQGAAPLLRNVLGDGARGVWVRRVAADALAELNDLTAAGVATSALADSDDRDLQCACLRLIERVGSAVDAGAARRLIHASDPMVRLCAIAAIGELGDRQDLVALRSAVHEGDLWIALNAARALRKLGDEAWLSRLASDEESRAQVAVQVLREASA